MTTSQVQEAKTGDRSMNKPAFLPLLAAAVIGGLYHVMAVNFWGSYVVDNPFNNWLLDTYARQGHEFAYHISISAHDLFINLLLALPVAALFLAFKSLNSWIAIATATASAIVIGNAGNNWEAWPILLSSVGFWFGLAITAFSLPLAFSSIRLMQSNIGLLEV